MVDAVKNNLEAIYDACKKYHVESLYLFGSGARGEEYNLESDLDFIFQYKKDNEGLPLYPFDYFDLLFTLEKITGKKVDLVAEEKIKNKYFIERVNKEKISIYES